MSPTLPIKTNRHLVLLAGAVLAGVATALLGLIVIVGWHIDNRTLIQVLPQFVPMQYNTALGFVFCGLALTLLVSGHRNSGMALGAIAALIGGLTLIEYIGDVNLGIDELFMDHSITTKTSQPGRMAPNTATCFLLFGLGVLLRTRRFNHNTQSILTVVLASITFGLSVVALSGYLANLETAYGWGNLTRMAVHTSLGFTVASIGLLAWIWACDKTEQEWFPCWMPIPTAFAVLTATLCLWQAVVAEGHRIHQQHEDVTNLSGLATLLLIGGALLALALALVIFFAQQTGKRTAELNAHHNTLEETIAKRTQELSRINYHSDVALELTGCGYWHVDYADPDYYYPSPRAVCILGELAKTDARYHLQDEWFARLEEANPASAQHTAERYQGAIDGRYEHYEATYAYRRPADGQDIWVHALGKIVRDENNKAQYMYGVYQDVTQQIHDKELLESAKAKAEEATRAKSDFLANMSHEIRTPMNGIMGMTDLALETELTPEQRDYLTTANTSAEALLNLINDILDFSKIEAGKLELDPIDFNLRDALADMLNTLANRAHAKGLELAYEVAPDIHDALIGDVHRLRQIIVNLVGNAIKFTETGEIVVRVNQLWQLDDEIELRFSVQDTGIGIPEEKIQNILNPFEQVDLSTTRRYGGTGLGLTISAQLAKIMGGRLWVQSTEGEGSTFHITSVFSKGQPRPTRDSQTALELLDGISVVIVDDNATNLRILSATLANWQMIAQVAKGGAEALALLESARNAGQPHQLIISDVNMPEMDGFDFFQHVHANNHYAHIPVILLTSAARQGDIAKCRAMGVAAHLIKPVKQSLLLNAIQDALIDKATKQIPVESPVESENNSHTNDATSAPQSALRILLAEDNLVNQKFAVHTIQKAGHTVTIANDGRQALQTYTTESFDLILMDVHMPEMDGLEATAAIREHDQLQNPLTHIPIIAMTANAMKGDREQCLQAGMDGYVSKPVKRKTLFAEINRVLEQLSLNSQPHT